ncbi:hypothetical protein N7517_006207 [Penicillium concentricum]|uniref:Aflatoxin regulatory protein domain-containing protein n=1 Tax=Penicillium concentricum TaxID=293559 RepID=A0A9W9VCA9_9EURO|nr:uncharacterized protein N7517_006207 [Penicillium concentricum]KAJ5374201.1 hypothetical protein N7517_006207 [Penicillium concentricum]
MEATPDNSLFEDLMPLGNDCDDLLHPYMRSGDGLFADASIDDLEVDLNVNIDPGIYLDTFPAAQFMSFGAIPDIYSVSTPCSVSTPHVVSDGFGDHDEPILDRSTLPDLSTPLFAVPDKILTPFQTPPPPTTAASCLAQHHTPCIITATQSLRSLHIPQTSCVSRRSADSHDSSGLEPPRMSGSVLKSNKDAGMSVCRMLQCACALRPQNQMILAIICSRLIAWYRAMIRACFVNGPSISSGRMSNGSDENPTSLEKVVHQPVTIGDHSVDDQALGLTIQAQVTLGELQHMQRLVETLSARMRETATSYPNVMQGFRADAGLPGIAHDRLVGHLLMEIHAAKADLMTAWETPWSGYPLAK